MTRQLCRVCADGRLHSHCSIVPPTTVPLASRLALGPSRIVRDTRSPHSHTTHHSGPCRSSTHHTSAGSKCTVCDAGVMCASGICALGCGAPCVNAIVPTVTVHTPSDPHVPWRSQALAPRCTAHRSLGAPNRGSTSAAPVTHPLPSDATGSVAASGSRDAHAVLGEDLGVGAAECDPVEVLNRILHARKAPNGKARRDPLWRPGELLGEVDGKALGRA